MHPNFVGVTDFRGRARRCCANCWAQHPDIHCEGHSSPLCNTLLGIRRSISDDSFFLAQLDNAFDSSYAIWPPPCAALARLAS